MLLVSSHLVQRTILAKLRMKNGKHMITSQRAGYVFCSFKPAVMKGADARMPIFVLGQLWGPIAPPGVQF